MYAILNLAVGGTWPGPPDETTPWPSTMLVDFVQVHAAVLTAGWRASRLVPPCGLGEPHVNVATRPACSLQ